MNIIPATVLAVAVAVGLTAAPAFAQQAEYVTVFADMESYTEGDTVMITGQVLQRHSGDITIQVLSPNHSLVAVGQTPIGADNTFSYTFVTGDIMTQEGTYTVIATYSLDIRSPRVAQTSFMYTPVHTPGIIVDGTEFEPDHAISGGTVLGMHTIPDANTLVISIDAADDGAITITLPRELIDSHLVDGTDDMFFVLADGEEVYYEETASDAESRTITVEFMAGTSTIEIIGTSVAVPEFGTIAALILAASVASIVALSARSRLLAAPKI